MSVALGWYFHLPPCASAAEVAHLAEENLSLLLEAHEGHAAHLALAATGSLLERLARDHAGVVEQMRAGVAAGWLELVGTTHYEVCAPLLPLQYLRLQISADAALKARLFGVRPRWFWPGNLAWTPSFEPLLHEAGIAGCFIDEAHIRSARETQLWHWLRDDTLQLNSTLVDTAWDEALAHRLWRLHGDAGCDLAIAVPSRSLRQALSFGNVGAIHRAWDDAALDAVAGQLGGLASNDSTLAFSADDGDRINPVSIHQYRRLLERIGGRLGWPAAAAQSGGRNELDFLPPFVPGGLSFWRDDSASTYLALLDELYRGVDAGRLAAEQLLALQDVFPIFWKRLARVRWFYQQAWDLCELHCRATH